ncbi:MAG: VWA domain-containing protein [Elusimicrobiota bacterium]
MFRQPWWLAAAVPVLLAAWALSSWACARRRRVGDALGRTATLVRTAAPSASRRGACARLRWASIGLLMISLAGPQFGIELVETRSDARQVVIAIDVSLSMLTADVKPNRLERAKASLSLLIDQLRGERVGVVAFAGSAQIICPLTMDNDAAKELLGAVSIGAVPNPGTAVGAALRTATAMLGRYPGGKAVVLLTDGEDHRSDPQGASKEAAAAGVRVFTVGIGTPEGEPIPGEGGAYHKNAKGTTVVSRLDENMLGHIARETQGAYYRTTPGTDEIADIAKRVKELDAAKGVSGTANLWRNRYRWPAAAAFLLLLIELALPVWRNVATVGALLPLFASPAFSATAESDLRAGNRLYGQGLYEQALERYARAAERRPKDSRATFNSGDALYRMEKAQDAAEIFEDLAKNPNSPPATRSASLYNLGNARYTGGDFAGAAAAYRGALTLTPNDAAARHNLAVAMERLKNPPKTQNKKDSKKDDPNKPQDKKEQSKDGRDNNNERKNDPPKSRPQDSLSKDEADRVLRAVDEREKQTQRQAKQSRSARSAARPPSGEDW